MGKGPYVGRSRVCCWGSDDVGVGRSDVDSGVLVTSVYNKITYCH